tara:strand:+ start:2287 stop:2658 length:372 start_codon:yes stop_codon:yes gene_type:complete
MKYLKYIIILFLISNINLSFADEQEIKLQNKITKNLRCLICQGQSIYDSDSQFAISLKILVEKKLSEGLSEKEIYEYFENKYGEWILYEPKFNKNTYFLWLLPILMFLLGGAILFKLFIIKKN